MSENPLISLLLLSKISVYLCPILSLCFPGAFSAISFEANCTKASPVLWNRERRAGMRLVDAEKRQGAELERLTEFPPEGWRWPD